MYPIHVEEKVLMLYGAEFRLRLRMGTNTLSSVYKPLHEYRILQVSNSPHLCELCTTLTIIEQHIPLYMKDTDKHEHFIEHLIYIVVRDITLLPSLAAAISLSPLPQPTPAPILPMLLPSLAVAISLSPLPQPMSSPFLPMLLPSLAVAISLSPLPQPTPSPFLLYCCPTAPSRALLTFFPRFQLRPLPLASRALLTFLPRFQSRPLSLPSRTLLCHRDRRLLPVSSPASSSATEITFFPSPLLPILLNRSRSRTLLCCHQSSAAISCRSTAASNNLVANSCDLSLHNVVSSDLSPAAHRCHLCSPTFRGNLPAATLPPPSSLLPPALPRRRRHHESPAALCLPCHRRCHAVAPLSPAAALVLPCHLAAVARSPQPLSLPSLLPASRARRNAAAAFLLNCCLTCLLP
ncbi:hypothetical protein BHM03_00055746 [Ensete ventricosum]|nr:hypothetical protein BHM03_00055746 [Ensete ventricosum]